MSQFKFSVGPWNVHEGADAFGPTVREGISFEEKLKRFSEMGFSAIQFHDDDAVPNINDLSIEEIKAEAKKVKTLLEKYNLVAEFVAPRLWEDDHTHDGGFTSMSKEDREFAMWRAYRSIDIAKELECDKIVLWLAREGTLCYESKDPVEGVNRLVSAIDMMLDYNSEIKVLIEPKPNEPIDRSFCPTMGHVMGVSAQTKDPSRVGGLLESAHAILAGLDPANEMAFGLAFGKLWGVHLNDQNGMKYDQDKSFGSENLRQAFNQVRVLIENEFGKNGEYVGLDVKAMRTQKIEDCYRHLKNSMNVVKLMEDKVAKFDYDLQNKLIEDRNYEALEMYVIELILGIK
ncbi:MAG: TIM barrel protein [Spirochaetaceae bacterium]